MRTHKNTTIAAILIVLHAGAALWAQAIAEDQTEAQCQSYFCQYVESFLPEPAPEPDETIELVADVPAGRVVEIDVLTGKETILETNLDPKDMPPEVWTPGREKDGLQTPENQFDLMNFSDLRLILNPEDWPGSPNCKIWITRHGRRYVASGVLIDAYHVLTAGHILHEGPGGNWSSEVVVIPAYNAGRSPFGNAQAIAMWCWEGWTVYGRLKDNIGIIRLDRPIGALAGWYGYGCTNDLPFYLQAEFHNPGYPAESPYNGEHMLYWHGTFDSIDYPLVSINRRGFGGQNGSGAYWIDPEDNHYVFAIFSHRSGNRTYFPIITEDKCIDIENLINEMTPSHLDLLGLGVQVSPGVVRAGDQLDSMSYTVYNHSFASWSGRVNVSVYLSTDDHISTSDILISQRHFTHSFGPKEFVDITASTPPAIPMYTASGEYWIGVMLDISDGDTSNNYSHGQEAARIVVY
jgi:V8-like Glu-specific endopeptidase